jgi:hypothetical protein
MTKSISIYLAGKIQKAHEQQNETYWTQEDQELLSLLLAPYQIHFLNPAIRSDDLSDQQSVFGRDMLQVSSSDVVFVDARDRRGLGVGAEMMWAKINKIPVLSLSPLDSHYHKTSTSLLGVDVDSWVHPFVEGLSDKIVGSLEEGATWLNMILENPLTNVKGADFIQESMQHYLKEQFPLDEPMVTLSKASKELEGKFSLVGNL